MVTPVLRRPLFSNERVAGQPIRVGYQSTNPLGIMHNVATDPSRPLGWSPEDALLSDEEAVTEQVAGQPIQVGYQPTARSSPDDYSTDVNYGARTDIIPDDLATIKAAADKAALIAVEGGEVTLDDAVEKKSEAEGLAAVLTTEVESEDDFEKLLAAIGPSEIDYTRWKSQAKELLGIDEEEADVPEWAAPMFMFGLKLMKGPVTGKIEGRSLLGGFLSDVGVAGEEAFPLIAVERARKRKQRAAIATVTMQLEGADASRKKIILDAWKGRQASALKLSVDLGNHWEKIATSVSTLAGTAQGPEHDVRRLRGMNAVYSAIRDLRAAGVTDQGLMRPEVGQFVRAYAASQIGVSDPKMKMESTAVGGVDYSYDPKALVSAWNAYNKANPNAQLAHSSELLSMIIAKDPSVANYQALVIGARAPNSEFRTEPRVNADGTSVTDHILVDKAALANWQTEFRATNQRDPTPAEIRAAQDTWRTVVRTNVTSAPNFVERTFTAADGKVTKYYINEAAFDAARRTNPKLTLSTVLKNPSKYSKILGGTITDYSKLQPEMVTITVGYGDDANQKRMFNYDKRGLAQAINANKIDPSKDNYIQKIIEAGLGNYIGSPMSIKKDETVWTISADGSMVSATGPDAVGLVRGLSSDQDAALWKKRSSGIVQRNRLAYEIDRYVRTPDGKYIVSGGTAAVSFLESGARLISGLFKGGVRPTGHLNTLIRKGTLTVGGETITSELSSNGIERMDKALAVLRNGEGLLFGGVAIDTDAKRGQVESMFVNLAFALASAREGGKLTDTDVENALKTLGWNGKSWTQTPERLLSTLRGAVQEASNSYVTDALLGMTDEDIAKHVDLITKGKGDVVEQLLRRIASASDPETAVIHQLAPVPQVEHQPPSL